MAVQKPEEVPGQRLRLGIIGCGSVAERHARAAQAVRDVEIVGATDLDCDRVEDFGARWGVPVFPRTEALLAADDVDAVVVATPTAEHAGPAVAAAEAGKHVLCEKPMATTLEDCDRIIETCETHGVVLLGAQVMQHWHARLDGARRRLDDGDLGPLITMHVRRQGDYRRAQRQPWKADRERAGGGVLLNLATYAIEEFQWFAGTPVHRVTARIAGRRGSNGIETEAMAMLEMSNGVVASFVELDTDLPNREEMDLVLANGSLRLSAQQGLVEFRSGEGQQLVVPMTPPSSDGVQAMAAQLAHFADVVLRGVPPEADGRWQRSVVAGALACYESARTGQMVVVGNEERLAADAPQIGPG